MDTFSTVAKLVTVKILLALAACQGWHLLQLDVNNAILNGDLFVDVYMDIPLGYKPQGSMYLPTQNWSANSINLYMAYVKHLGNGTVVLQTFSYPASVRLQSM